MMSGRDVVESPGKSRIGSVLGGRWQLVGLLGSGLVSHVYEATDETGGRVVASVLRGELVADSELREGFVTAGREAARVGHADSVWVLGHGLTDDGYPFVVSELLEGETFAKLVQRRRGRLYPAEALRLVRDALDVVAAAHANGIVHGELTPDRLFITDGGTIKVLGFGITALRRRAAELLEVDTVPDAESYRAPEQQRGGTAVAQSDLFALGAVLYTLLTGLDGAEPGARGGARSLVTFAPTAPPSLLKLVERALAPTPEQRFPDARAMRAAVDQALMLPELLNLRSLQDAPARATPTPRRDVSREPPLSHRNTLPAPSDSGQGAPFSAPLSPPSAPGTGSGRHATVRVAERAALRAGWRGGLADTMPAIDADVLADVAPASAQRPARAQGELDIDGLRELFAQLERTLLCSIAHGAEHAETARGMRALGEHADELLATTRTALYWNVTETGFAAAGKSVWQPQGELARVPARLFSDGVRLLALLPGLERSELGRLVEILAYDPDTAASREDDLVTLLWQAALPHVMHHAVGPFVDQEARARFEQEKRETVALVRFDTSFQLEDCWREARGDTSPAQWRESLLLVLGRRRNEDGQTFVGGRAALRVDPAEREATAARLASEERVGAARFEAVLRATESSSGGDGNRS
jgi:serine/threonine-protein kinase